tara:strand:+ start:1393 stop:2043 length:651 start_codon:yes stop_codon:yes gene_type:complete
MISDFQNKKILLVSPHPDDVEIGMGGTTIILSKKNKLFHIVCTNGSRSFNKYKDKESLIRNRKKESEKCNKFMNIDKFFYYGLDNISSNKNISLFKTHFLTTLNEIDPDIIFCPHPTLDKHPTHRKISKIILKNTKNRKIKIFFYEVWGAFNKYDHYVNIDKVLKKKLKIINFHKSQVYYKEYALGIAGLNHYHAVFNDFGKEKIQYIEVFIENIT